ncbi:hypothetical protein BD324DRAFT_653110 [Kockovaella imperatae]|uniref:Uncharacterized protein n=1 Tax=Kockovaella imperatae TaxID=4999 RepID=A0A1Y1UCS2_9TREE|nr:hypothetical protein BD324DRAFT_653110 [Kockovaella imperatae]ORX34855.1 hypothetical protein BD324DRAFT_653110 [Kockovaella imperatae]
MPWARSSPLLNKRWIKTGLLALAALLVLLPLLRSKRGSLKACPTKGEIPPVHLLLPITKDAAVKTPKFCRALLGAIMTGYDPIIMNWDVELPPELDKLFQAKHLQFPENDLVFLVDALDVWLQLPPADVARRFLEYGKDVLVGAERHCVPNSWPSHECQGAPQSPLPIGLWEPHMKHVEKVEHSPTPRHANSGTVLGRAGKMEVLFRRLAEIIGDPKYPHPGAFNTLLVHGDLGVDYYSRLFWNSASDESSLIWLNTLVHPDSHLCGHSGPRNYTVSGGLESFSPGDPIPWHMLPSVGHNQLTGQIPAALHFNAIATKNLLQDLWGKPWYSTARFQPFVRQRVRGLKVKGVKPNGDWHELDVESTCANHLPGLWPEA